MDSLEEIKQDIKEIKETVVEIRISQAVMQERCKIQCEKPGFGSVLKTILAFIGIGLQK